MASDRSYSTADICALFSISKSTLFRWERENLLEPVGRGGPLNQRQYSTKQIGEAIKKHVVRRRHQWAVKNPELAQEVLEYLSLVKLISLDMSGLWELAERKTVAKNTIRIMVRVAMEQFQPEDEEFAEILDVASRHSKNLAADSDQKH